MFVVGLLSGMFILTTFDGTVRLERTTEKDAKALYVSSSRGMYKVPSPGDCSNYTDWQDVDLAVERADCGRKKCFFHSIHHPDSLGYLVAAGSSYPLMAQSQQVAEDMAEKFGSKHFMLDTVLDYVTSEFKEWIEGRVYQPNRQHNGHGTRSIFAPDSQSAKYNFTIRADEYPIAIQRVELAPSPALFFAVAANNRRVYRDQLPSFLTIIPDRNAFAQQLDNEIIRMVDVLKAHPHLTNDFQRLIDLQGRVYHMDMDNHLKYVGGKAPGQYHFDKVLNGMKELLDTVLSWTPPSASGSASMDETQ